MKKRLELRHFRSMFAPVILESYVNIYANDITERKKAEAQIIEQLHMLDLAHVIVKNMKDEIIFWNSGAQKLYGFSKEEALGKIPRDLLKTKFPKPIEQIKDELLLNWKMGRRTRVIKKPTERKFSLRATGYCTKTIKGKPVAIIEVNNDITERKKAEEALRESEQRWATTLASIGDAVIATDVSGKVMFMNSEAEELTGWALSEASQKPVKEVFNIVNEQTRLEVENPIERVLKEGMVVGLANHTVLIRKDGSEVPIDDSGAPIKDKEGKTTGVVLVFRDITERKQQEREIENIAKFPSENPNPIFRIDGNGTILYGNQAGDSFLTAWNSKVGERAPEHISQVVADALASDKRIELEETFGTKIFLLLFAPVILEGYVNIYANDITERKKAEEALRKLNRHLRAVSNSNQALMHATDEAKFTQEVCNIIIKDCGYALVWVGFAEHDQDKTVRPVAFAGFDKGYIDALRVTWDENSERGRGPTGTVIRTGKPYICKNMQIDPNFEPWRPEALKRGYTASLVLPLTSFEGETFGALNIYSKESDPFTDEEVKLLTELANDFSYGIGMLRLRKKREQDEETLRKQASLIDLSPDAIIVTELDGTITFWSKGAEKLYGWTKDEAIGQDINTLLKTEFPHTT